MSVVSNNILAGASGQGGAAGYAIERSLRFNSGDSAYLNRTFSAGNRKTWTWSGWFKLSKLGQRNYIFTNWNSSGQLSLYLEWTDSDKIRVGEYSSSAWEWQLDSTSQFRDPSAWYHLVVAVDTTQSTASDRVKVYVNGEQLTSFSPSNYPNQNKDTYVNQAVEHNIGRLQTAEADFYLADVHFIDGQALAATDFGETDQFGVWQPKEFAGTYGPLVNQAQNWTNATTLSTGSWTGALANMFNGSLATAAYDSVAGATATITLSQSYSGLVRVYNGTMIGTVVLKNGSTTVATYTGLNTGVGWETVATSASSFNKIEITSSSGSVIALHGIEIGGNLLVDSGVTVADNSFHLDFADNSSNAALGYDAAGSNNWTVNNLTAVVAKESGNWDSMTTGSPYNSSHSIDKAFDGSDSTGAAASAGTAFVFTPSTAITGISKVRIRAKRDLSQTDDHDFKLNGTNIGGSWSLNSIATVEFTVNNLTSLLWATKSNGHWYEVLKIEIYYDGSYKTLVTNTAGANAIDSLVDTPTNGTQTDTGAGGEVVGNYATWNPLSQTYSTLPAITDGNLTEGPNAGGTVLGTIAVSSGKWYWEIAVDTIGGALVGATSIDGALTTNQPGYFANSASYIRDGRVKNNGSDVGNYATYTAGDIIGVALDMDNGAIKFYKNNTLVVTINSNISGTWTPAVADFNGSGSILNANFGQRAFSYPLSGYKSLNTANLPTPTIADGSQYFDTKLYDGTGSTQALTMANSELSPDFVWIKNRNSTGHHSLFDSVRGATKILYTNLTAAENTIASSLSAFNNNGFTVVSDNDVNGSTRNYAAWVWDAADSTVPNTDGSITSQVRANPSAGFSIVKYTYSSTATVGHGLNAQPHLIIQRPINSSGDWYVYTKALGFNKALYLNLSNALGNTSTMNSVDPTSTVFTTNNWNAGDNLAYCFAPVEGYSAMGTYTGNGSTDGTFVYTGMKVRFLIIKQTDDSNGWFMWDTDRDSLNPNTALFSANASNAEQSQANHAIDFLSNGFKARDTNGAFNDNGKITYISHLLNTPSKLHAHAN